MALVPYNPDSVLQVFYEPERAFHFGNIDVTIAQDWGGAGVAAVVWDFAIVLATYLQTISFEIKGKNILELGAGTGLVGIVTCFLGANVVITDTAEALEATKNNVIRNLNSTSESTASRASFSVDVLHWGKNLDSWKDNHWDYVIGADIIYIEETFSDLLRTLQVLTESNKQTVIFLSCKIRYDRDTRFLKLLTTDFVVEQILHDLKHDIKIFKVLRKDQPNR